MSINQMKSKLPIINVHAHIFTKDHTPKYLAKKILPWPLYKLLETDPMLGLIKRYLKRNQKQYTYIGRNKKWKIYKKSKFFNQSSAISYLYSIWLTFVWIVFGYYLLELIGPFVNDTLLFGWLCRLSSNWLDPIMPDLGGSWNISGLLLLIVLAFKNIRQSVKNYGRSQVFKAIGKDRLEFLMRYINIVRFSGKKYQANIFNDLEQQYPADSKFVILPMDMEHMGAGPVKASYLDQMQEVLRLKKNKKEKVYPFIFVDPRRIRLQDPEKPFLSFDTKNPDKLILNPCSVKDYIDGGCAGIKIYPALGYYVFEKELLQLWLYCVQNEVPITTHCSIGPIYYRGNLQDLGDDYDLHPIFKEVYDTDSNDQPVIGQLRLTELKNKDFQKNFTHPLNYVCLLHTPLFIKVLEHYNDQDMYDLFGYKNGAVDRHLSKLKINLAHYGSSKHWDKFLRQDRYGEANAIIKDPKSGLRLKDRLANRSDLYSFWHSVDWFSIISSMLLNFDNVYADISYTSHDLTYLSLLSEILENPKIGERVLFGTDFYVVSNHKTEKQYWIDMQIALGVEKWNLIANKNPTQFLKSELPGSK